MFLGGMKEGAGVGSGTDPERAVFEAGSGEFEGVEGPSSAGALVVSAHIKVGIEVEDSKGALGSGGVEGGETGKSDFVTAAETDDELGFFESGGCESGIFALGGFKVFIVAGDVAEVTEFKGLMDAEVSEGLSQVLRALLGADSALVTEDAFVAGESD